MSEPQEEQADLQVYRYVLGKFDAFSFQKRKGQCSLVYLQSHIVALLASTFKGAYVRPGVFRIDPDVLVSRSNRIEFPAADLSIWGNFIRDCVCIRRDENELPHPCSFGGLCNHIPAGFSLNPGIDLVAGEALLEGCPGRICPQIINRGWRLCHYIVGEHRILFCR